MKKIEDQEEVVGSNSNSNYNYYLFQKLKDIIIISIYSIIELRSTIKSVSIST